MQRDNDSENIFVALKYLQQFVNNVVRNFNQSSNSLNDSHFKQS